MSCSVIAEHDRDTDILKLPDGLQTSARANLGDGCSSQSPSTVHYPAVYLPQLKFKMRLRQNFFSTIDWRYWN
jgi:hypothetical protein